MTKPGTVTSNPEAKPVVMTPSSHAAGEPKSLYGSSIGSIASVAVRLCEAANASTAMTFAAKEHALPRNNADPARHAVATATNNRTDETAMLLPIRKRTASAL